jgi:hypothetical protein
MGVATCRSESRSIHVYREYREHPFVLAAGPELLVPGAVPKPDSRNEHVADQRDVRGRSEFIQRPVEHRQSECFEPNPKSDFEHRRAGITVRERRLRVIFNERVGRERFIIIKF